MADPHGKTKLLLSAAAGLLALMAGAAFWLRGSGAHVPPGGVEPAKPVLEQAKPVDVTPSPTPLAPPPPEPPPVAPGPPAVAPAQPPVDVTPPPPQPGRRTPLQKRFDAFRNGYKSLSASHPPGDFTPLERTRFEAALDDASRGDASALEKSLPGAEAALESAKVRLSR